MPGKTRKTTAPTPAEVSAQQERDAKLRKAYGVAAKQLREAHQDEFNELHQAAAAVEGIEWTPRATPEQKAADQIDALLAEFPNLKDRLLDAAIGTNSDPSL